MKLAFVDARPDVAWNKQSRSVTGTCDGVEFSIDARWWGSQCTIAGGSPFPMPESLIVYASAQGMDHGYWRDLPVGDRTFDYRYFVFSDVPALLPLVIGEATRRAMSADPSIVLYIRDRVVQTTSTVDASDAAALARHVAVHHALAEDHRACLARWGDRIADAQGMADATWPPTAMLMRPTGMLEVSLGWTAPASRDGADWDAAIRSLRTAVVGRDDRQRPRWTLSEVGDTTACTHVLGGRRFRLIGTLPLARDLLGDLIERGNVASISCGGSDLTVALHGMASAPRLEAAVRIVQLVVDATSVDSGSPYR